MNYRDIIQGPRWAGISTFIKDECWGRGLDLTIESEKGWIRETVRIEISGDDAKVEAFRRDLYSALEAYRSRGENRRPNIAR